MTLRCLIVDDNPGFLRSSRLLIEREGLYSRSGGSPSDVILISTHAEEDFADLIAANPAAGFISKSELSARAVHGLLDRADGRDPLTERRGT